MNRNRNARVMDLYYELDGWTNLGKEGGIPLVLVAGLASDLLSWTLQREALEGSRPLLVFDHRGVGRTPRSLKPFGLEDLAEDLLGLLDKLGTERVDLVGHSMGGAVVQTFLRRYPDRARKAVVACSFARPTVKMRLVTQGWVDALTRGASAEDLGQTLFPWLYTEPFLEVSFQNCVEALASHPYPLDAKSVQAQCLAMEAFDSRDWLAEVPHPVLVLSAERDLLVEKEHSELLLQSLPAARSAVVPGGHSCMLEAPNAFLESIIEFLDSTELPN